jgi:hypothetical protein
MDFNVPGKSFERRFLIGKVWKPIGISRYLNAGSANNVEGKCDKANALPSPRLALLRNDLLFILFM